jgi:hypothetical protein
MPHLLATISAHGLGHLAQSAEVLQALRRRVSGLRLTIASTLPEDRLRARIGGDFAVEHRALDFGFVMEDALQIARQATAEAYRAFHAHWDQRVSETTHWLGHLRPHAVLANAAYLPLAAAREAGIPAFGMCSLNWADLVAEIYVGEPWMPPVHAQMLAAYRSATAFIKLAPGMPMSALDNAVWAAPVARLGRPRHAELRQRLAAGRQEKIVLIALGGIATRLPLEDWQLAEGLRWLVPADWQVAHPRVVALESLGWPFIDLVASVDAVLGKPGYGTFAEAACNGTPMLYAPRPDWPEQAPLIAWLQRQACAREVAESALRSGALPDELAALWRQPRMPAVKPGGADEVAERLALHLRT